METNDGCNNKISKLQAFNTLTETTMVANYFFSECMLINSIGRSHSSWLSDGTQLSGLPDHLMFPANYHPSLRNLKLAATSQLRAKFLQQYMKHWEQTLSMFVINVTV